MRLLINSRLIQLLIDNANQLAGVNRVYKVVINIDFQFRYRFEESAIVLIYLMFGVLGYLTTSKTLSLLLIVSVNKEFQTAK